MLRKCIFFSIVMVITLPLYACGPKEVSFPDQNLEVVIREAIDKPEGAIFPADLEELTFLNAPERDIIDVTGLEYCTNLTRLIL
jgi:internalin A